MRGRTPRPEDLEHDHEVRGPVELGIEPLAEPARPAPDPGGLAAHRAPGWAEAEAAPYRPWRKREAFLIGATALAVLLFLVLETRQPPFSSSQTVSQNVFFFFLINLNIVLILLLVFLLGRNIVKLVVERRRRVLGSHLRTRLVAGFVAVAIAPAVLLFLVALGFIRTSIETWFSVQVEGALEGSLDMADAYYRESMSAALREAGQIAARLGEARRRVESDKALVEAKQREYGAASVAIFGRDGKPVASAWADGLSDAYRQPVGREFLDRAVAGREATEALDLEVGDLLRAGARIDGKGGEAGGVVVVEEVVPGSVVRRRDEIEQSYRQYKQLKLLRRPLINNYVLTLLLASLVVLFGGTWLGFAIARTITGPIERLAEGTRRVAAGHLDEQIGLDTGSDELATLVLAFNQMTANLRRTHGELEERRRTLEAILANITGGVVSIDPQGRIEMVNAAACSLLGVGGSVVGRAFREALAGPRFDRVRELLGDLEARAREGIWEKLAPQRLSVAHADGAVELLATGVVLRGDHGNTLGGLLFFEDVTELLKVQRMEAWREVARRIAHEIKNPLTPIQLSAQRLRKRYAGELHGAVLDECTRTIIAQVDVLKSLVSEFAHFARLPAGPHLPTDLNALVEEVLVLFREAHREVIFAFRAQPGLPLLDLDRDGMRRVLTNILDNAVAALPLEPARGGTPEGEATPDGAAGSTAGGPRAAGEAAAGEAASVARRPRGSVQLSTQHDVERDVVCLEIADDGIGMTPEVKARLFEPYFSTKPQGTGLGLAIASAVLADHQAFIRVRDNQPRGSRFVIELPVGEPRPAAGRRASA